MITGPDTKSHDPQFRELIDFLCRVPSVQVRNHPLRGFGTGTWPSGGWWVKFSLDIKHPLAWNAVQELGYVLNYLSVKEQLPTVFKPVSPPPYMNGGPREFLSWVIECPPGMSPATVAGWLEGRLPKPVEDMAQWAGDVE